MKTSFLKRTCVINPMLLLAIIAWSTSAAAGKGPQYGQSDGSQLFTLATECSACHDNIETATDAAGESADISFVHRWSTTMMRFSFLDPFWRAKVRSEELILPTLTSAIEKKCSRCHAPMANEQAVVDEKDIKIFGPGSFTDPAGDYYDLAMQGVSCVLCHQIKVPEESEDGALPTSYTNSGAFSISTERVAWSKYFPDFGVAMQRSSGFLPEYAEHLKSSAFCATCHDLYTDYFDAAGNKVNIDEPGFPEQTPYQEWLASDFSAQQGGAGCQDCHLTSFSRSKIAAHPSGTEIRPDVFAHTFLTENTMMLSAIASLAEELGIETPDLEEAVLDGQDYLTTAGTIDVVDAVWEGNELAVTVKIANMTGHKLPTSIPIRRVFIHFAVYEGDIDAGEIPLFSSGDTNESGGIIGVDDVDPPQGYEEHHDIISEPDQVQIYEGVMETSDGEVTTTLLRAADFAKDNRLLPLGWNPTQEQLILNPRGKASTDSNFIGGEDTVVYRMKGLHILPGEKVTIEAELKDQTLAYPFVEALRPLSEDDATGTIATFLNEYEHHKVHFELIDSDLVSIVKPTHPL